MRKVVLVLLVCFIYSCSNKKEEKQENTIGSSLIKNNVVKDTIFTSESYSTEALQILDAHKKRLKTLLPQMILAEVEIYKITINKIEKKSAMSYSLDETDLLIDIEKNSATISLLEKEVELNQSYFQLFNELSLLNEKYKHTLKVEQFIDFYDAGPIVLAEEVMIKIDELVKDEESRTIAENKKQKLDIGLTFVSIIPGATVCKGVLGGLTQAAKVYKAGVALPKSATLMSKIPLKIMNQKVANFVAKTFKNDQIRSKTSKIVGYSANGVSKLASGIRFAHSYLRPDQASEMFKVLENKINGRIGDFSDGILSVHMQRVRDIIKLNTKLIQENNSNL